MAEHAGPDGLTRREVLERGAALGVAAGVAGSPAAFAARRPRRQGPRLRSQVAVLGGGMAGLAAAHELVERGFGVTVYESTALGGKARSIPVPGTAQGGRLPLPGEHGFRFFPGFYHHVPDSMRRIPFPGNRNGVWDNLVAATEGRSPRTGGRPDGQLFGMVPDPTQVRTPEQFRALLLEELARQRGLSPAEYEFFANRVMVFLTSCDERRYGQWEHTAWKDFVRADRYSDEYRRVISSGLTRSLVAAKENLASTRTIGNMAEAFIMNFQNRGNDGAPDRVLNAPTNEAWIDPWIIHLRELGVRFRSGIRVTSLQARRGRIVAAGARDRRRRHRRIEADWFVCAMPAEQARRLWNTRVLRLDPSLELMNELFVDWMAGIQFFLTRKLDLTHGHLTFVDAPWALTALTQAQFWGDRDFARDHGDGRAVDCLSVDISDWDTPGIVHRKPAKRCTPAEVAEEVWAQLQAHLNDGGVEELPDGIVHSWFLDPGIRWDRRRRRNRNQTPLLVNTVGTWDKRPAARTEIPNLFLAGDYVQTDIDLATMEGANESGRAAVNALLDAADSRAERVRMFRLYDPPEFAAAKRADLELWKRGQPNVWDHHP